MDRYIGPDTGALMPVFEDARRPADDVRGLFRQPSSLSQVSFHSGLPMYWRQNGPAAPRLTRGRRIQLGIKRGLDVVIAGLALAFLLPLFAFVAFAIVVNSPGPVFFKQRREGLNGESFEAYKFRSMRTESCDISGVAQTRENDPRVTAVGRFIRKTSIDELPQLFNVLKGEMSLVGPRPHVPNMLAGGMLYNKLVPYYSDRLSMRPGITGWAQANGYRGATVDRVVSTARVDHDIAYIQNFSLWLDLKVIVMTVVREFLSGSGN